MGMGRVGERQLLIGVSGPKVRQEQLMLARGLELESVACACAEARRAWG